MMQTRNPGLLQYAVDELLLILRDTLLSKRLQTADKLDIYKQNKVIKEMRTIFAINDWFEKALDQLFPEEQRYSNKVTKALQYIHAHYKEDIGLGEISSIMDVSIIYASQLFKKEVGESYIAYLTSYRMNKAMELLQSGNYKVYEISEMVGYQSTAYFCRMFKKWKGMNPTEYENRRKPK